MIFQYTVDPSAEEPIMLINKHIGYDDQAGMGIMGDQFQAELMALDAMGKRLVNVWITSQGGSVLCGEKIYSAILNTKCKVDTYCMGLAASIAAVIFQAGRKRYMADYAKLMYHNAQNGTSDQIRVFNDTIATMICERAGQTKENVAQMMNRTTWILANEAVKSGFCDDVISSAQSNKGRLSRLADTQAFWKESVEVMNSILKPEKHINKMDKITNKLGLVDGANEENILTAITTIENKYNATTSELAEVKNKLEASTLEVDGLKNQVVAFEKAEAVRLEVENAAKEIALKNDAKVFAENLVKEGKLKNEAKAIENVINAFVKDSESITEIYNAMPLNKTSVKFEVSNSAADAMPTNAMSKMAELKVKENLKH